MKVEGIEIPEVWVIRHKETRKLWTATSGKQSWKKVNHAKSAWAGSYDTHGKFNDQQEYEVVCLYHPQDFEKKYNDLVKFVRDHVSEHDFGDGNYFGDCFEEFVEDQEVR